MVEPYLNAGKLISEEAWLSFLQPLEHLQALSEGNRELILQKLEELLIEAVKKRLPVTAVAVGHVSQHASDSVTESESVKSDQGGGSEAVKIGVLFSGGIDSTLIAFILKRLNIPFTAISIGFQDGGAKMPEDIVESKRIAEELGFNQERLLLDLKQMEAIFKKTAKILGKELLTVINLGVGSVEVAAMEKGKELGITHFFGGLGSEEIFAGYERHENALETGGNEALHAECLAGLKQMYQRDLRRDTLIPAALGVTAATPFLDKELITFALSIPPELKINPEKTFTGKLGGDVDGTKRYKKLILREMAMKIGLPEEIAFRPKRAAQYGSRTNNALTVLRKAAGCRDKEEYLTSLHAS